jgi:hypothetical protein
LGLYHGRGLSLGSEDSKITPCCRPTQRCISVHRSLWVVRVVLA